MRSNRSLTAALVLALLAGPAAGAARAGSIAWSATGYDPALVEAAGRAPAPPATLPAAPDLANPVDDGEYAAEAPLALGDAAPSRPRRAAARDEATPVGALLLLGTGLLVAVSGARKRRAISLVA